MKRNFITSFVSSKAKKEIALAIVFIASCGTIIATAFPFPVFADFSVGSSITTVNTGPLDATVGAEFFQPLGNGVSGSATGFTFSYNVVSASGCGDCWAQVSQILGFASESDYLSYIAGGSPSPTTTWNAGDFSQVSSRWSTTGDKTYTWDGSTGNLDGQAFNPAHWYIVRVSVLGWIGTNIEVVGYGVSSSEFANDAFVRGSSVDLGSVKSLAISMQGVDIDGFGTPDDTSTRIDSVTPAGGATIATSTAFSFGVSGYISPDDLTSGTKIRITGSDNAYNQISSVYTAVTPQYNFEWIATSTGAFSLSTTTSVTNVGNVNIVTSIESPSFFILGWAIPYFNTTLVSTSTTFTVSTTTSLDNVVQQFSDAYDAISVSGTDIGSSCTIVGFDFVACISGMLVPNTASLLPVFSSIRDGALGMWPIGYITRTAVIMSGSATSTLPSFEVAVPVGFPGAGDSIDLTPWNELVGPTSILGEATSSLHAVGDTASGKTLREIVEPGWNTIVYVIFAIVVVFRLLGLSVDFGMNVEENEKMYQKTLLRDREKHTNFPWGKK